jgi:hypothetical protein
MSTPIITNFKWHVRTGYREYMRTPEVVALLQDSVDRTAEAAGDGFEADVVIGGRGRKVAHGQVRTATAEARERQARDHVLERAIDAGR